MTAPILVTGGAGFLGGWLTRRLVERGAAVRVLDLPGARWDRLPAERIAPIVADIRDAVAVARAVRGCRVVFHLAGLPHLWAKPRDRFRQVNAVGARHVLGEAVRAGCERVVHVSSATIWPRADEPTCRWADAVGPYCQSKLRAELEALRLVRGGAPIILASPAALIGPDDPSRTPPTQLLLDFCRGLRGEYVDARLDLIDVRDAADALIAASERGVVGRRYLLGNTVVSVLELYQRLAALTGRPAPGRRVPYPLAQIASILREWWADVVTARPPAACVAALRLTRRAPPSRGHDDLTRLGVTPRPLDQTLADVVAWFVEVGWLGRRGA